MYISDDSIRMDMTDIVEPIQLIKNIEAWVTRLQHSIKTDREVSVFDIYAVLRDVKGQLSNYIETYTSMCNEVPSAECEGVAENRDEDEEGEYTYQNSTVDPSDVEIVEE